MITSKPWVQKDGDEMNQAQWREVFSKFFDSTTSKPPSEPDPITGIIPPVKPKEQDLTANSKMEGSMIAYPEIKPPQPTNEQEKQWWSPAHHCPNPYERYQAICKAIAWATPIVAQQAADAELEACCKWLVNRGLVSPDAYTAKRLRKARRPEPKSKLQRAEELINDHWLVINEDGWMPSPAQWHTICEGLVEGRRALESIPEEGIDLQSTPNKT